MRVKTQRWSAPSARLRTAACMALAAACLAFGAGSASAQATQAEASVTIRSESRVTKLHDLDFGKVIPGNAGGTMTIAPDGGVTATGSVVPLGGSHPAQFNLTRRFLVDYPAYLAPTTSTAIDLVNQSNPAQTMRLTDFRTDFNRRGFLGLPAYFFLTSYDFNVAGTLTVGANQPSGTYVGTFEVSVDYQ